MWRRWLILAMGYLLAFLNQASWFGTAGILWGFQYLYFGIRFYKNSLKGWFEWQNTDAAMLNFVKNIG